MRTPLFKAKSKTYGYQPSWTDHGTIVHEEIVNGIPQRQHKKVGAYSCDATGTIDEWDPLSSAVTPLLEGDNPDAW